MVVVVLVEETCEAEQKPSCCAEAACGAKSDDEEHSSPRASRVCLLFSSYGRFAMAVRKRMSLMWWLLEDYD